MLHLWFYYIAGKDLWLSRLFASLQVVTKSCNRLLFLPLPLPPDAASDLWAPKTNHKLQLKTTF